MYKCFICTNALVSNHIFSIADLMRYFIRSKYYKDNKSWQIGNISSYITNDWIVRRMMTKKLSVPIARSLSCIRTVGALIRAGELQGWLKVVPPRRVTYAPSQSNEDLSSITLLSSARIVRSRSFPHSRPFRSVLGDAIMSRRVFLVPFNLHF